MSNESDDADLQWMRMSCDRRCLTRSRSGTQPNGWMCSDKDGQLLAEGWHEAFGQAHAEVNAR